METLTTALTSWYQFTSNEQSVMTDTALSSSTVTVSTDGQKPFDYGLLFRGVIIVIGFVGILANGLVLITMAASKEVNKSTEKL